MSGKISVRMESVFSEARQDGVCGFGIQAYRMEIPGRLYILQQSP